GGVEAAVSATGAVSGTAALSVACGAAAGRAAPHARAAGIADPERIPPPAPRRAFTEMLMPIRARSGGTR
ncbi:MAG: hypothetical protein KGO51_08080, partial [Alphaproteobacteria bacterium]|nr:hypothetical protein [Alphaproteobacteria bacterium]